MSKRVIYVALWDEQIRNLIAFLKEKEYDSEVIGHLEYVLDEKNVVRTS